MKESLRSTLRNAFFEALFVVFGVVLALAANEWRENVKARQDADAALDRIVAELQANLGLLDAAQEYHLGRTTMIQRKLRAGETVTGSDFPQGFINPAWVTETAWEVAKETGATAHMDYDTLLEISAAYDRLAHYRQQTTMAGNLVYAAMFEEGMAGVSGRPQNLMMLIYTFIYREQEAVRELTATLAELGAAPASGAEAAPDSSRG